ncbi:hypothetical protein AXG93_2786s1030 [Marchantia polymorpha subsp. ruderalis]|uniref:Uncharacterized protein n=1 Tax=Marchantia polymorpha subsp. ruderalis TaxID=1480154 RepID=A0A176W3Z7_MARPO|nr:hypothetical protein AXG93_2786s1030 [Marchantia polymorpha subsp. ruderalis]
MSLKTYEACATDTFLTGKKRPRHFVRLRPYAFGAKYADPRYRGCYVELVRNRTRIKVATNPELISLDQKYRELEEKNDVLQGHLALSRRLHKTVLQLRDDAAAEAQREFEKQCAKLEAQLHSKRIQNGTLAKKLVRQTRLLE